MLSFINNCPSTENPIRAAPSFDRSRSSLFRVAGPRRLRRLAAGPGAPRAEARACHPVVARGTAGGWRPRGALLQCRRTAVTLGGGGRSIQALPGEAALAFHSGSFEAGDLAFARTLAISPVLGDGWTFWQESKK